MLIFNSKKGVSPLIATILLISFAVALGSIVMNWGLSLDVSRDRCRNVEIKVRNIDGAEACFGGLERNGYINFIIDNTGRVDVTGLSILIIGENGTDSFDIDNILIRKGALYEKRDSQVTYDFTKYRSIQKVQFIPKIRFQGTIEVCTKNDVKAEKINVCAN